MSLLTVTNLNKQYPSFRLKDVSFSLDKGYIMGFIGINGAGKTTTLKSILSMVQAESGSVFIMGKEFRDHQLELKEQLGIVLGETDIYKKKKIKTITDVVKRFYTRWDNDKYNEYCRMFNLDGEKALFELSQGMRTKYFITLALSHNAKLFILDEPTSGLDPAARDDLLEIFQKLVEDGEKSILFSTHITSDLEKCADFITYIHDGKIIASDSKDEFLGSYKMVKGTLEQLNEERRMKMISYRKHSFGFSGLIKSREGSHFDGMQLEEPTLEEIMIYYSKQEAKQGGNNEEYAF